MARHILLLEDDIDSFGLLETSLTSEGHIVSVCHNPDDLVVFARAFPDAVALVDFWGRSQFTLSNEDRDQLMQLASAVPMILVTERYWAERCKPEDLGVMAILPKPFTIDALCEAVERCVVAM